MNLIDNGLDSFKKAFNKLCSLDSHSEKVEYILKDIILDFHHSFEVLFKALLYEKDPTLLYSDLERYYDSKFNSLIKTNGKQSQDIHTITFMQAFKRVIVCNNIKIDNFCYQNVIKFNELRNSLTHYETIIKHLQVRALIANVLFNILPILESINEFKNYIEEKSVFDNLKKIYFIRDEWVINNIIYLLNYKNQDQTNIVENSNYKRLLLDIGYSNIDKLDVNYISENEYVLSQFETEFYEIGISGYYNNKVDIDNPYIMELIKTKINIIELSTNEIIKEKIANDLAMLLSVYSGNIYDFNNININEVYDLFYILSAYKKLTIGFNLQKIEKINKKWEDVFNKENKYKKIANIENLYEFNKTSFGMHNFYNLSADGKYKFTIKINDYLETMKDLFNKNSILLSSDSEFAKYVSAKVIDTVERYLCYDTIEFFCSNLMGKWGNNGTIERIDEINFCDVKAICNIINLKEFTIWGEMELGTEYYFDHEYYSDGYLYKYISLKVYIDDDEKIYLSQMEILN
ncbi:hypothetical protein ACOAOT_22310 [Lacrimispora sp. AGF001]|uniref:hypothetical protein n=1 Tax=Lacrimispora sp. AGF001 TaxID=3401631 RepID=UPI003B42D8C8